MLKAMYSLTSLAVFLNSLSLSSSSSSSSAHFSTSTSTDNKDTSSSTKQSPSTVASCRDRFLWPFSNTSIWNTAIGDQAIYLPANLYDNSTSRHGPPMTIHNDQEWLILTDANDPIVEWKDQGGFPGSCSSTGPTKSTIPMPYNFTTDCVANNNGAGVLLPDNVTLTQLQPLYRGTPNSPIFAWYQRGCPQPFPWNVSILSDGNLGAHGGSGLSSFGGSIRSGELLPDAPPIAHAIKLELWSTAYYFYNYSSGNYSSCYTWPAIGCDSYYNVPGVGYNGTLPYLHPGSLLAIPPAIANSTRQMLTTIPGQKLLDVLVDFGGYIVDDTGSEIGGAAICMEHIVNDEIKNTYGYSIAIEDPLTKDGPGSALFWDIVIIFQNLHVVVNNGPNSIGGGGVPRRPAPPPICGAD